MSSIIDEIAKAEAQAASIRQEATLAAKDNALAAQAEVEKLLAAEAEVGRAQMKAAAERAEEEGASLGETILESRREEAAKACAAAQVKLPEAVSYLLRRVVSSE